MTLTAAVAPRSKSCSICKEVSAVEHVTMMLFDEAGNHLPAKPAIAYVKSIGVAGTPTQLYNRLVTHRKHVENWIRRGQVVAPMEGEGSVVRIGESTGPTRWLDAQQNAIDLGNEALRDLAARLAVGALEPKEVIALARIGVSAANTRGALEQKGKALSGIDRLLQLAAGGVARAE